MMKYELVAQDVDSEKDCGFNLKFDKPYNLHQGFPVKEIAAQRAIEEAYNWYPTAEMNMELEEGETVGYAFFDENGKLIKVNHV
jgi:hypothetical protein